MTVPMTLKCFQCGKTLDIISPRLPEYSFELIEIAEAVRWVGAFDFNYHRSLVFCSNECDIKARKKDGTYRLRPLIAKTMEVNHD